MTTPLARCPFPGCPIRYRAGPNRECADHQNEVLSAAAELGIDLTWMDTPPGLDVLAGRGGGETVADDLP